MSIQLAEVDVTLVLPASPRTTWRGPMMGDMIAHLRYNMGRVCVSEDRLADPDMAFLLFRHRDYLVPRAEAIAGVTQCLSWREVRQLQHTFRYRLWGLMRHYMVTAVDQIEALRDKNALARTG